MILNDIPLYFAEDDNLTKIEFVLLTLKFFFIWRVFENFVYFLSGKNFDFHIIDECLRQKLKWQLTEMWSHKEATDWLALFYVLTPRTCWLCKKKCKIQPGPCEQNDHRVCVYVYIRKSNPKNRIEPRRRFIINLFKI